MKQIEKLVNALACVKEIEAYVADFEGDKDYLENIKEPLEEVKTYLSDAIAVNAKRQ